MRASQLLNGLVAVMVIAVALFSGPADGRAFEFVNATGAVSLSNSREGAAILGGSDLRPSQRSSGTVTIGNRGSTATAPALEVAPESETAGSGGGRLWDRTRLVISDQDGATIYAGRVADLNRLAMGALAAGAERTYTFTAWLPSGADDNAFQGARLSLRFTWLAEAESAPAPTTTAEPTPALPPANAPAARVPAPATPDPNAAVSAEQLFALPSAKACLSNRALKVRVRAPRGVKVTSVRVYINNHRRGSFKGAKASIDLRGRPRGTFGVKLRAALANGRKLTLKRTYRTCATSTRPGTARSPRPR